MLNSKLPTEVELIYEVMPCNSMRCSQEPIKRNHSCKYFRKWGTYHSYDYLIGGKQPSRDIVQDSVYLGKASLLPEVLSGCRKAPIMAVGINPNLPAFWKNKRNSVYPLFDDYKQYAHYFRYRAKSKLEIPEQNYKQFGGGDSDDPFSDFELNVPPNPDGEKIIPTALQEQAMYKAYEELLDSFAKTMGWAGHKLSVGEDFAYGNMVACPSAKWTTKPDPQNPDLPPMTEEEREEIVKECFFNRKHFLRQFFQSQPKVVLVFSQNTANAFISTLSEYFIEGNPKVGEPIEELLKRVHRIKLGNQPNGDDIICRVIFCPHATGTPEKFEELKKKIIECLVEEGQQNNLSYNSANGHLHRNVGSCVFCPMLELSDCDYRAEVRPMITFDKMIQPEFESLIVEEKKFQTSLLEKSIPKLNFNPTDWTDEDE